jgi:hypothetical protein
VLFLLINGQSYWGHWSEDREGESERERERERRMKNGEYRESDWYKNLVLRTFYQSHIWNMATSRRDDDECSTCLVSPTQPYRRVMAVVRRWQKRFGILLVPRRVEVWDKKGGIMGRRWGCVQSYRDRSSTLMFYTRRGEVRLPMKL